MNTKKYNSSIKGKVNILSGMTWCGRLFYTIQTIPLVGHDTNHESNCFVFNFDNQMQGNSNMRRLIRSHFLVYCIQWFYCCLWIHYSFFSKFKNGLLSTLYFSLKRDNSRIQIELLSLSWPDAVWINCTMKNIFIVGQCHQKYSGPSAVQFDFLF